MSGGYRHHSKYVSSQDVVHNCLLTYKDMFSNMSFQWYVQNVYDSVARKGYIISYNTVEKSVAYFLKDEIDFCPHCLK